MQDGGKDASKTGVEPKGVIDSAVPKVRHGKMAGIIMWMVAFFQKFRYNVDTIECVSILEYTIVCKGEMIMKKNRILTAFLMAALMMVLSLSALTGCSGSAAGGGQQPLKETSAVADGEVISTTSTPSGTIEWVTYQDPNQYFTMNVPKGWTITTYDYGTDNSGSGLSVSVANPDRTVGAFFMDHFLIKKTALSDVTVDGYFRTSLAGITEWTVVSSTVTNELQNYVNKVKNELFLTVYDAKKERVKWTQNGIQGEGYYSAVIHSFTGYDAYYVSAPIGMYAPRGTLDQWQNTLDTLLSSFKFTQKYLDYRNNSNPGGNGAAAGNTGTGYTPITYDGNLDAWNNKNKSEDIYSQKRHDALFGNQRVQDNDTGEIYNADSSWYDQYSALGGERYSPIDNDQYLDPTNGNVGW